MRERIDAYIVIAQQEWELNLGSNARNLAETFHQKYPVLYVNPAVDIKSIITQLHTSRGWKRLWLGLGLGSRNTHKVNDQMWVHTPASIAISINWLRIIPLYNFFNRINAGGFFRSLRKAVKKIGWAQQKCIVFNDSQMFTGLYTKELFSPLLNFYYIRDNLVEHPYFRFHGSRIEPKTVEQADAVFANSAYLAQYASRHQPKSFDIGQGCELDMYDAQKKYPVPNDMAHIAHPRIGYIGFLTGERLDISLLEELAMQKGEWQFVLIGPEEIMFQQSRLHTMPNVHFLGSKKPVELPGYLQQLDVCLNPQLINPLTVGNYPRKIDEYLAMGKPTVATETPAMHMFLPHVYLAVGVPSYIQAIGKALDERPASAVNAAIELAKGHTWEACVEKIYAVQNEMLDA